MQDGSRPREVGRDSRHQCRLDAHRVHDRATPAAGHRRDLQCHERVRAGCGEKDRRDATLTQNIDRRMRFAKVEHPQIDACTDQRRQHLDEVRRDTVPHAAGVTEMVGNDQHARGARTRLIVATLGAAVCVN